jgi:phosphonate dehydrogenase
MLPLVVVTHWTHPAVLELLRAEFRVVAPDRRDVFPEAEVLDLCRSARAVVMCMSDRLDESFLRNCPDLAIVATVLKGYDNFDVGACTRNGVWFTNVPDLLTAPTAELTIGLLLGLGRNLMPCDRLVRSGEFAGWRPTLYGCGLADRTVGLVGMGALGRAVARRLVPFEAMILYADPVPLPADDPLSTRVERVALPELLGRSDYVVLLTPLTGSTHHLIGREQLKLCRHGAYLVNVGRGSVVDELAVADELASGHLAGFAADVFAMEDWVRPGRPQRIPEALLADGERTLFTPHLGSAVDAVRREISLTAARNVLQVLRGEVPENAANRPLSPRLAVRA